MPRQILAALFLAFLAMIVWLQARTRNRGPEISGHARVIDGDSLVVGGREVRLRGIDAPEGRQTCERDGREWACGEAAAGALRALIAGGVVQCRLEKDDRFGRGLGRCEASRRDLAAALVTQGYALAYGDYKAEERAARAAGRGIWAGTFERPRAWRDRHGGGHR